MEATWVGCLVLVVAPKTLSTVVAEAVARAARAIADHPVYIDATRVSTSAASDPLSGDLDTIASTLYQDMVSWGASRERNPAPRAAFCVLVIHTGQEEADGLVDALTSTASLRGLPVSFRTAAVDANDTVGQTFRHIFDAADQTLHEIDATPEFSISTDELSSTATLPSPRPRQEVADTVAAASTSTPVPATVAETELAVVTAPSLPHPFDTPPTAESAPDIDSPAFHAAADVASNAEVTYSEDQAPDDISAAADVASRDDETKASLRSRLRETLAIRSREREARRHVPTDRVSLINDLSTHTAQLSLLYLVAVAEPTRPRKSVRKARTDLACDLARALLTRNQNDQNRWYVRAFTAGARLHPGAPLPSSDMIRDRDFPEPRSEHLDLFDVTGDVTDTLNLDVSSFRRRDVRLARVAILFHSGALPQLGEDTKPRLNALCASATVIWVHSIPSGPDEADEADFAATGVSVVQSHDDILDELLRVVDQPFPTGEEGERPARPAHE